MDAHWMFMLDIGFYIVLGLLAFPLLILIVSLACGCSFKEGHGTIKEIFKATASVEPNGVLDKVLSISGVTSTLLLLGFVAYVANRLGDEAMPRTSGWAAYFGNKEVRWSVEDKNDWKGVKYHLRDASGIGPDRDKWEKAKTDMGAHDSRLFRTMAVYSFWLFVAAAIGLAWPYNRNRAWISLAVGFVSLVLCHWLWVEREGNYIENVVARCVDESTRNAMAFAKPKTYPGHWPQPSRQALAATQPATSQPDLLASQRR